MKRKPRSRQLPLFRQHDDLVVDLFAGGGGASVGIEAALGRPVDIAINHDSVALAVHCANHPRTVHLSSDIWEAKPRSVTRGRRVRLLWASPDCTDHSNAKGGKPRRQHKRSLAWAVTRWAKAVRPDVIFVENVPEFRGWGPLGPDGKRMPERKGETFARWIRRFERLGYRVEHRILDASHYGAPTRRRRFFLVARCDGQPIVWPEATHGPGKRPLRTAADCIDWSLPCPSIFERKRPLAEKTLWRIAQGLKRFVFENPRPFIIKVNHGGFEDRSESIDAPLSTVTAKQRGHALVEPFVVRYNGSRFRGQGPEQPFTTLDCSNRFGLAAVSLQHSGNGEREGQRARTYDIDAPLGTVMAQGQKHALVSAFLARHFGDPLRTDGKGGRVAGKELDAPMPTVTVRDHHSLAAVTLAHFRGNEGGRSPGCWDVAEPMPTISAGGERGGVHVAEVRAFLTAYYGSDSSGGQAVDEPMRTITAKHRLGIVTVEGVDYQVTDIGFRMLEPHELKRATYGRFADSYDLSRARTKRDQVRLLGNAVPPEPVEALIAANVPRDEVRAA